MAANPMLLQWLALYSAGALGLWLVVLGAVGLWRAMRDERPLLLADVLGFEGIDMAQHVQGAGARQFALAARKCMDCAARDRCEAWLADRTANGYQAFCPNAAYVARLKPRLDR